MVVMLPGQELAQHLDAPWFWGANRFTHPQWLLVAMAGSRLWEHLRVPQIQGLVWLHKDGTPDNSGHGGQFYLYPDGPAGDMVEVNSTFNAMLVTDGCRVIHGVNRFHVRPLPPTSRASGWGALTCARRVPRSPSARSPNSRRRRTTSCASRTECGICTPRGPRCGPHPAGDAPQGSRPDPAALSQLETYKMEELRVSLVWRARCFESEEEKRRWDAHVASKEHIPLEEILDKLTQDLRRRGALPKSGPVPPPLELADLMMREYAPYPIANTDKAFIPYNYCALERLAPAWLKPAVNAVLDLFCE